jgi:hypothetical protein
MTRITTGLSIAFAAVSSHAHGGHGLKGTHWHATDTFGLLLVGALAALAIWLSRK